MTAGYSVILCEGYDDRAFLTGWLERRLQCTNLQHKGDDALRDAGLVKCKGEHVFTSRGQLVRIQPCEGDDGVFRRTLEFLTLDPTRIAPSRILICVDGDDHAAAATTQRQQQFERLMRDHNATLNPTGIWEAPQSSFGLMVWRADLPAPQPGVPPQQTLERVVCQALAKAFPERAARVQEFVDACGGPGPIHKALAWSHMAGGYPKAGCQFFYERLWMDPDVAPQLDGILQANGATSLMQALVLSGPVRMAPSGS